MASRPRYVLIIEDNVHHAELLTELLDKHFAPVIIHTVDTFGDGRHFLSQSSYDLILATGFIGDESIASVVKDIVAAAAGTPIIVIAGRGDESLAARLTRKGVSEYLVKTPDTLERLPDVINKQFRKAKRRKTAHHLPRVHRAPMATSGDLIKEMELFREQVNEAFSTARLHTEQSALPDIRQIERLQMQLAHVRELASQRGIT